MTVDDFLDHVIERNELFNRRLEKAITGKSNDDLLRQSHHGEWSPIQVVEHMTLANSYYLPMMSDALASASRGAPAREIKHSFFGRMIIKATGPNGNAPAPASLHPKERPDVGESLAIWRKQQEDLLQYAVQAKGIDLSIVGVRNPIVKWIRMNLADCFEVMTVHTDRHVGQIEERLK